jgi:putative GTP pyrophosphokinase
VAQDMYETDTVDAEYGRLLPRLGQLETEAVFIVQRALAAAGIKTHSVPHRVKDIESAKAKLLRLGSTDFALTDLTDLVGLRVVVLFLSDLPRAADLIRKLFDVKQEDDKVSALDSEDAFGYMSHHFIVRLEDSLRGPRYDDIKNMEFEIQLRTILMDAWANVSHYLDYKGDSSIPEPLRRDFYALSGLFYVADKHFELFFDQSKRSQEEAVFLVANEVAAAIPLDLDTLQALLAQRYPDREGSPRRSLSPMVEELTHYGFRTIADVEQLLDRHNDWFVQFERKSPPETAVVPGRFAQVGVVRLSLQNEVGQDKWMRDFGPASDMYEHRPASAKKSTAKKSSAMKSTPKKGRKSKGP